MNDSQRELKRQELEKAWPWERIFSHWQRHVMDLVSDSSFDFVPIPVFDPAHGNRRPPVRSWWARDKLDALRLDYQRHLDECPGTLGLLHRDTWRRAEHNTAQYLYQARDNRSLTAAVLVAGSVFSRVQSSRAYYPKDCWPPRLYALHLGRTATDHCHAADLRLGWHYSSTQVLPYQSDDYHQKLEDTSALVRYLAKEHATLFLRYALVEVLFEAQPDPAVAKILQREYQQREEQARQREAKQKAEREARRAALALKKQKHPRFGEWRSLPAGELQRLVWSMPTVKVADLFGISDVAVGKRCKALGIPKPPVGFWRKVEVGHLPHPNGKPVYDEE